MPLCSREIFTKLCRLINAGEGAFQDSFHAIVITAKLMYMMEHHWQHYCLGRDSPLMLLVVAWRFVCILKAGHQEPWENDIQRNASSVPTLENWSIIDGCK